jgi:hypothetical protein
MPKMSIGFLMQMPDELIFIAASVLEDEEDEKEEIS